MATTPYKSLVLPVMDYGDVIYMATTKNVLNKLQQIQNVCCRIILRTNKRTPITEMHKELNLLKLELRREQHLSELCHKNIYLENIVSLGNFFNVTPAKNQRETRQ